MLALHRGRLAAKSNTAVGSKPHMVIFSRSAVCDQCTGVQRQYLFESDPVQFSGLFG